MTFDAPANFVDAVSEGFKGAYEFLVAATGREAAELCPTAEVLVMVYPMSDVIEKATSCRWIHVIGAGVDGYLSIERVRSDPQLRLTNSSEIFGSQVSEHAFALLLGLTRRIGRAVSAQAGQEWYEGKNHDNTESEISGRSLTIVGLGDVGLEVAKRAKAFGLTVTGISRSGAGPSRPGYDQYFDRVLPLEHLDESLEKADIVLDALPLTAETRGIFNGERFSRMRPSVVFLNVGRGSTVDEQALIDAIKEGRLAMAGLDVFASEPLPKDSPLWKFSNVIITSHRAGKSDLLYMKAVHLLRENLARYSKQEPLKNAVDKVRGY